MVNSGLRSRSARRTLQIAGAVALAAVVGVGFAGCAKHYQITDTTSGQTYYTKKYKKRQGAVQFTAARTGASVNLQNTEIERITKKEFKSATSK